MAEELGRRQAVAPSVCFTGRSRLYCGLAPQQACRDVGIEWVASARDIQTPVSKGAKTAMSGLSGVSMLFPERIAPNLVHIATNFQATSAPERAFDILDAGGILSIKAHITKNVPGH